MAAIPSNRQGIIVYDDWDNMGQRQTDSGSVTFERVELFEDEILGPPGPLGSPFASLRPLIAQLMLSNIYLGIAQGAFAEAIEFAQIQGRPWFASGVKQTGDDPYLLRRVGELSADIRAAKALTESAAAQLQIAWQRGDDLTIAERGELALEVAAAKIITSRVGLEAGSKLFDITGARATHSALNLDRYWRNARVHTLHDPVDYKLRDLGDWALNRNWPTRHFTHSR